MTSKGSFFFQISWPSKNIWTSNFNWDFAHLENLNCNCEYYSTTVFLYYPWLTFSIIISIFLGYRLGTNGKTRFWNGLQSSLFGRPPFLLPDSLTIIFRYWICARWWSYVRTHHIFSWILKFSLLLYISLFSKIRFSLT